MKCFYHTDMDGKCSAAIVRKFYTPSFKPEYQKYIPINYKDDFPFGNIIRNELVIIVDFSLQKDGDFEKLLGITKNVIWIDHHKSAIKKHKHISKLVKGIQREDPIAGCGLTWKYFFSDHTSVPKVVALLGDYDTWTFQYGDDSKYFQLGCKVEDTHPKSDTWGEWLSSDFDPNRVIENGKMIDVYEIRSNESYVNGWGFFADFEGYKAICCNLGNTGSRLFESVTVPYDLMLAFIWDGNQWTVSIYTEDGDIDCSKLAEKYGGGGHPGAAGFQTKKIAFQKN